jgi:hypothetical protein
MLSREMRFLLVILLIACGLAAVAHAPAMARSGGQGDSFSGAAFVVSQTGLIGSYSVPEPPGYPPIKCQYQNTGDGVITMQRPGFITVMHRDVNDGQKIGIEKRIYQRLASGGYSWLFSSGGNFVNSSGALPTVVGVVDNPLTVPAGPDYILVQRITWYSPDDDTTIEGFVDVAYELYRPSILGSPIVLPDAEVCHIGSPAVQVSATSGTVNSTLNYTIKHYPQKVTVQVRWDGAAIDSVVTNDQAQASGSVQVPASPMGKHTLKWTYGKWSASSAYTVKPRIKVTPSNNVMRDQTVNVSLRGFAAHETVKIRWKKNATFSEIASVMTSSTGSANLNVKVPKWVPNGGTSVRGDGSVGHAQTNAVTVSGGPFNPATVKTPTPTPTQTATSTATTTAITTNTATTEASPTASVVTETATVEPTATTQLEPTLPPAASPIQESI